MTLAALLIALVGCAAGAPTDGDSQREARMQSVSNQVDSARVSYQETGDEEQAMSAVEPDLRAACWFDRDGGQIVCATCCYMFVDEFICCYSCDDGGGCG
jgi:hypothetical protein